MASVTCTLHPNVTKRWKVSIPRKLVANYVRESRSQRFSRKLAIISRFEMQWLQLSKQSNMNEKKLLFFSVIFKYLKIKSEKATYVHICTDCGTLTSRFQIDFDWSYVKTTHFGNFRQITVFPFFWRNKSPLETNKMDGGPKIKTWAKVLLRDARLGSYSKQH